MLRLLVFSTVFGKHCECIAQKCTHLERVLPLASHLLLLSYCVRCNSPGAELVQTAMAEGGGTVGRTVRCSRRREGHALPSSTATDLGTGISPSPGSWRRSLRHRSSAPARNSNSGAQDDPSCRHERLESVARLLLLQRAMAADVDHIYIYIYIYIHQRLCGDPQSRCGRNA